VQKTAIFEILDACPILKKAKPSKLLKMTDMLKGF